MKIQTRLAKAPMNSEREWVRFNHCYGLVALKLVEWFDEDGLSFEEIGDKRAASEHAMFVGWLMDMRTPYEDDGYGTCKKEYYVTDGFRGVSDSLILPTWPLYEVGDEDVVVVLDNKMWRVSSYYTLAELVKYPNHWRANLKHKWVIDPLAVSFISQYGHLFEFDAGLLREILDDLMLHNICEADEIRN